MTLSFQTVRTVVSKANGTDCTTGKHLERVAPGEPGRVAGAQENTGRSAAAPQRA